jgi:hypothetical protein
MKFTRLIRWMKIAGFAGVLIAVVGCSNRDDENHQSPKGGTAAQQSTEPVSSAGSSKADTDPPDVIGHVDSRIPWSPGNVDQLRGLHLRVWGLTNEDVKKLQDVVSGRRKVTPRISEIWFTAKPPRLRVDRFWDQTGPYPKDLAEFEGHAWETMTFEGKPFVLYERVIVHDTQETTYKLKKLRTVFNRDGVQGARAEIGTFTKTVRAIPAPTVATALKAGTIDIPVMSSHRCELWLKLLEESDRTKQPERYEQAMAGLRERRTIAGRTAARHVHSAALESILRYDFIDLPTAIGLEGYLTGWAGQASYRPAWKDNYCIYRVVRFDPTPPACDVFDVWKD